MSFEVTLLGLLTLPITLGVAVMWPHKYLSWFTLLAVFPVGSVFLCSVRGFEFGVTPAFVGAILLILVRLVIRKPVAAYGTDAHGLSSLRVRLLTWCLFCALTGYIVPTLITGRVTVADPRGGMGVTGAIPLAFRMTNITQITYLLINVSAAVAISGWVAGSYARLAQVVNGIVRSGFVVVGIAAYQFIAVFAGLYFPYEVINGNPQTALGQTVRPYAISGMQFAKVYCPFSEPSTLSQYLIGLFMGCVYLWSVREGGMRVRVLAILSGLMLLLTISTTGYVGLVLGSCVVLASTVRRGRLRSGLSIGCTLVVGLLVLYYVAVSMGNGDRYGVIRTIATATSEKMDSGSFAARAFVDQVSLEALIGTYGLGVGWGSTRASSLAINLLASGGLCGAALLAWFAKGLVRVVNKQKRYEDLQFLSFVLLGNLIGGVIAVPDVNGSFLWLLVGAVMGVTGVRRHVQKRLVLRAPTWSNTYETAVCD